ncbi:MAG: O-acetylhomoserine aminocarboxypropyltransferase/cysteine synthase [Ruminococcaceae bacterium]|nr:O-acetylhomoserine aminocarboxypropyltransferase/cysteine synthase [Oscillospiraceae bacterium]
MKHINTKCVQAGYDPKSGEARVLPIYQSTTFKYEDAKTLGDLFDFNASGHFYTRLSNPTVEAVEKKIAALEGGVGAMLCSSGQGATTATILTLCKAGDHLVSSSSIYGGSFNLLNITLRKMGIDTTFVSPDATEEELRAAIRPNTKLLFGESVANPALSVLDIEKWAKIAHENSMPLVVDNTFPTPINCRPFEWGADIIIHSTSKYMDGHAMALGGCVVDSGKFDWKESSRHADFCAPDESYHGLQYPEKFGAAAFIAKARAQMMRDIGMMMSPMNAFLLNVGLETLHLRMPAHCANAKVVAAHLMNHPKINWVNFPELADNKYNELAKKYMPNGTCGVISFGIKGGREAAAKFMESVKMAAPVIHVADARTCILHPASTTHRQLSDQQLIDCGVTPDLIRMSVGIEHIDDIIADIDEALENC